MFKHIQLLLVTMMLGVTLGLFVVAPVLAVDVVVGPGDSESVCDNRVGNAPAICKDANPATNPLFGPDGIITAAIRILSYIIGALAVVVIIFQAIRMVASAGDPQSVRTARNGIIYALIGLVVAALAQAIVAFILNKV